MTGENHVDRSSGTDAGRTSSTRIWLSAGALTIGIGAAMLGGAAVAVADVGSGDGSTSSSSSSSDAGSVSAPSTTETSPGTHSTTTSTADDEPTSTHPDKTESASEATTANGASATKLSTAPRAQTNTGTLETTPSPQAGTSASKVSTVVRSPTARVEFNKSGSSPRTTVVTKPVANAVVASASQTAVTATQAVGTRLPTPNQILDGLRQFGTNLYLTVTNQIYGLQRNVDTFRDDLAKVFGISRVVITKPLPYGNPAGNQQYFVPAQSYTTAPLATIAMAYGQLTGTAPDLQGFTDLAKITNSLVYDNQKIYLGPDSTEFVKWIDSYELLQDKNVRTIMRDYGTYQSSKAFNDLTNGLQDPTKVMIATINGPIDGRTDENGKTVVVLGVDNVNGTVTINDPTRADGQGLTMSVDDFMNAWSGWKYKLVTTQLASSPSTPPPAPSRTKLEWSLPRPDQIGRALQSAISGIAQLVVHQIDGVRASFADLSSDLARTLGVADPADTNPPAPVDVQYGNYARNYQYWNYQGNYGTCALMATAAVIAQLTGGGLPVDMSSLGQDVIDLAENTVSGVRPGGVPMFQEPSGTYSADVVTLLNMYGLNADYVTYLKTDGNQALQGLTAALGQGQGAIVSVNNRAIYNAYTNTYFSEYLQGRVLFPPTGTDPVVSNHAVVVLGVDLTKNVVYLNDSAWQKGQGLPVPLDEFMKAWQYSNYGTVTAEQRST